MIEALVALFVFSVGALGLAAMQTAALAQGDDSKQRALAIWKAQELADRIRSTKSQTNPAGLGARYQTILGNNANDIGTDTANRVFTTAVGCATPVAANRCADHRDGAGTFVAGAACNNTQLVTFDIWDVMCEPGSGLTTANDTTGSVGLLEVEVDLVSAANASGVVEYTLYMEWVSRNTETRQATNTNLQNITTNLCGNVVAVEPQLDVYCLRFN